jgi:hypothetical protein
MVSKNNQRVNMKKTRMAVLFITAVTNLFCSANGSALAADNPLIIQSQGPGWESPKSAADRAAQQRFLNEAYARQQAQQESAIITQQDEILKIYSKDPWRKIDNSTNYVGSEGWLQFQGKVQAIEPAGILFQGSLGRVLSISTETDRDSGLTTTHGEVSNESESRIQNIRKSTTQTTHVIKTRFEKQYGDDYFMVLNFPYPTQEGNGYERMMAFDAGYITYTNSANSVLTVHKLDYGKPCIKIWSAEEIAEAYKKAEDERAEIEAARKAQRDLIYAQAEKERAEIEAKKKAELDKIIKWNQEQAEKGDTSALHRLGERYRDGDGVTKDLAKSAEYFKKADEQFQIEVNRIAEETRRKEQAALQQKFLHNLDLADNKDSVESALYIENCYRYGLGTEKDLSKAEKYHAKAVSLGIPQRPNTMP